MVVHPFSNLINEWVFLIYISVWICQSLYMNLFITSMYLVWTCGSSTKEIILPRLKYIGEFLFTSPKQSKMNLLCSLSGARLRTIVSRVIPIKLSSIHKIVVMVRSYLWVCLTQSFSVQGLDDRFVIAFYSSMYWTKSLWLAQPQFVHGLDECSSDYILS